MELAAESARAQATDINAMRGLGKSCQNVLDNLGQKLLALKFSTDDRDDTLGKLRARIRASAITRGISAIRGTLDTARRAISDGNTLTTTERERYLRLIEDLAESRAGITETREWDKTVPPDGGVSPALADAMTAQAQSIFDQARSHRDQADGVIAQRNGALSRQSARLESALSVLSRAKLISRITDYVAAVVGPAVSVASGFMAPLFAGLSAVIAVPLKNLIAETATNFLMLPLTLKTGSLQTRGEADLKAAEHARELASRGTAGDDPVSQNLRVEEERRLLSLLEEVTGTGR